MDFEKVIRQREMTREYITNKHIPEELKSSPALHRKLKHGVTDELLTTINSAAGVNVICSLGPIQAPCIYSREELDGIENT